MAILLMAGPVPFSCALRLLRKGVYFSLKTSRAYSVSACCLPRAIARFAPQLRFGAKVLMRPPVFRGFLPPAVSPSSTDRHVCTLSCHRPACSSWDMLLHWCMPVVVSLLALLYMSGVRHPLFCGILHGIVAHGCFAPCGKKWSLSSSP